MKKLLQSLQKVTQASSISCYKGTRVAIDASGWLHKGLYAAAEDFVDSGESDCCGNPSECSARSIENISSFYRSVPPVLIQLFPGTTLISDSNIGIGVENRR